MIDAASVKHVTDDFENLKKRIRIKWLRSTLGQIGNEDDCVGFCLESMIKSPKQTIGQAVIDYIRRETGVRMDKVNRFSKSKLEGYFSVPFSQVIESYTFAPEEKTKEFHNEIERLANLIRLRQNKACFVLYWKWGLTLVEIGDVIGVSNTRVHQILAKTHIYLSSINKR